MATVADIHWIAGFLDGEACFYFNRNACRVQVVQKDPWTLHKLQALVGGTIYKTKEKDPHGPYYLLMVIGKRAVGLMFTVYALMSPRRQAKIASNIARWMARPLRGKCNIKTHCKNGHELNASTTFMKSDGSSRECIACSKTHKRNWYERNKEKSHGY
jgi:hypothetical protein